MRLRRILALVAVVAAILGYAASAAAPAASAAAAPATGWVRCANLSPGSQAVETYLVAFGNPGNPLPPRHVSYGDVSAAGLLLMTAGVLGLRRSRRTAILRD